MINSDIAYYYSGSGVPSGSLGGAIHANEIPDSTDENSFENMGTTEAGTAGDKYFCFYVKNEGSVEYTNVGIWISNETLSTFTKIYVAAGTAGKNSVEQTVSPNTDEPAGVTWQRPLTNYQYVVLPNLAVNDIHAIWMKRAHLDDTPGMVLDYFRLSMVGVENTTPPTEIFSVDFSTDFQ